MLVSFTTGSTFTSDTGPQFAEHACSPRCAKTVAQHGFLQSRELFQARTERQVMSLRMARREVLSEISRSRWYNGGHARLPMRENQQAFDEQKGRAGIQFEASNCPLKTLSWYDARSTRQEQQRQQQRQCLPLTKR